MPRKFLNKSEKYLLKALICSLIMTSLFFQSCKQSTEFQGGPAPAGTTNENQFSEIFIPEDPGFNDLIQNLPPPEQELSIPELSTGEGPIEEPIVGGPEVPPPEAPGEAGGEGEGTGEAPTINFFPYTFNVKEIPKISIEPTVPESVLKDTIVKIPLETLQMETPVPCPVAEKSLALPLSLPEPLLQMDFESENEWAEKNAVLKNVDLIYIHGKSGNAVIPRSGVIAFNPSNLIDFSQGTISIWVKRINSDGQYNGNFVIFDSDNTPSGFRFFLGKHPIQNFIQFYAKSGGTPSNPEILSGRINEWSRDEWHNIVIRWNENNLSWFMDGRLWKQMARPGSWPTNEEAPQMVYLLSSERYKNSPSNANGSIAIDSLRSYRRALSDDQISDLYMDELSRNGPVIKSGRTAIHLLGQNDSYGFEKITDEQSGRLTMSAPSRQLWKLRLRTGTENSAREIYLNNTAAAANCLFYPESNLTAVVWNDISLPDPDYTFTENSGGHITVRMEFAPDNKEDQIKSRIIVTNYSLIWTLQNVDYFLGGLSLPETDVQDTVLLRSSFNIGSEIVNPYARGMDVDEVFSANTATYPGGRMPVQLAGLYDQRTEIGGLYIAANDNRGYVKSFTYNNSVPKDLINSSAEHGIDITLHAYAEDARRAGNDFDQPWQFVIGVQDGNWYDFARKYRKWATQQAWMGKGPIRSRTDSPEWMANAGFLLMGPLGKQTLDALVSDVIQIQTTLPEGHPLKTKLPGSFFLWHHNIWQYANNYYLPKRYNMQINDTPSHVLYPNFNGQWSQAQSDGTAVAPYFLPVGWDAVYDSNSPGETPPLWNEQINHGVITDEANRCIFLSGPSKIDPADNSWKNIVDGAPDQCRIPENVSTDTPVYWTYRICPSASLWHSLMSNAVRDIMGTLGARGMYLDVLPVSSPRLCYSTLHNHSPGGGNYHTSGYRNMLEIMRNTAKQYRPEAGFYGEGFSEPYIDLIDGFLIENFFYGSAVPLAPAIYHDYAQFIGRRTDMKLETEAAVLAKQGELFSWGAMPGYLIGKSLRDVDSKSHNIRKYIVRLAMLRQYWKDYLVYGEMLPPLNLDIPSQTLNLNESGDTATITTPTVAVTAWRSPQGATGILVMNLDSGQTHEVDIPLLGNKLGITSINKVTLRNFEKDTPLDPSVSTVNVNLLPLDVVLIEVNK